MNASTPIHIDQDVIASIRAASPILAKEHAVLENYINARLRMMLRNDRHAEWLVEQFEKDHS